MPLKLFQGLGALIFVAFAAVQFNDPDPAIWIIFYGGAAIVCVLSFTRYFRWTAAAAFSAGALLGAGYLSTEVIGKQHLMDDEQGREMLGLAFTGVWMIALAILKWRQTRITETAES